MGIHEWIGGLLLCTSALVIFVHRVRVRRERLQPTFRHSLFASHLTLLNRTR
jgi:hypothetical protein